MIDSLSKTSRCRRSWAVIWLKEKNKWKQSLWSRFQKKNWCPKLKNQARFTLYSGHLCSTSRPSLVSRCSRLRIPMRNKRVQWSKVVITMSNPSSQLLFPAILTSKKTSFLSKTWVGKTTHITPPNSTMQPSNILFHHWVKAKGNVLLGPKRSNNHHDLEHYCDPRPKQKEQLSTTMKRLLTFWGLISEVLFV